MDCPGIIARDIDTVKDVLGKCEGYDPKDPTSLKSIEFEKRSGRPVIGIPVEFNVDGISEQVRSAWSGAAVELLEQGFDVVQVSIPSVEHSLAVYYIIAAAEASSNLSRYTGLFYGHNALNQESFKDLHQFIAKNRTESFGKEVKRRILTGTFVLSSKAYQSYFEKAQKIRKIIYRDFQLAFQKCDFLLTPTCPSSAVPLNGILNPQDPTQEYAQDVMTVPANLVGIPAISIPRKAGNSSLPIGLQLMGKRKSDYELLKLARMLVH
jgi:aspartyl-tRNA(Asn)/glutamyl-tRNA(Gln) amidotransferase subunit A